MNSYFHLIKQHITEIWDKVCLACASKSILGVGFGIFNYLIGVNNSNVMGILVVLVVFDFITAIMSAYKTGVQIESRRVFKTPIKIFIYTILVSAIHLVGQVIGGQEFLDYSSIGFLVVTEAVSILENIARMGFAVPSKVLNRLLEIKKDDVVKGEKGE